MASSNPTFIRRRGKDLTGLRFGRFTVISFWGNAQSKNRNRIWVCRCDCGVVKNVQQSNLIHGQQKSCGCFRRDIGRIRPRTHGMKNTPEYKAWCSMRGRCRNPNLKGYPDYGGRGISVCARWEKFEHFFADMGKRPEDHTFERRDVNGNYEPKNCRWATRTDQQRNRRSSHMVTLNGETYCLTEWAEILGLSRHSLSMRARKTKDPAKLLRPARQRPCPHCGCLVSF